MPLTFAEAKLQYNPDPTWEPKRNSSEYYEILALMKQSGTQFHSSTDKPIPKPMTVQDTFKHGQFHHPINNTRASEKKKYLSKAEFLAISSNRKAFKDHMAPKEGTFVDLPQILVSKATLLALKTQAQTVMDSQNRIKKMSKEEFLNMSDNREFVRQHILLNKN